MVPCVRPYGGPGSRYLTDPPGRTAGRAAKKNARKRLRGDDDDHNNNSNDSGHGLAQKGGAPVVVMQQARSPAATTHEHDGAQPRGAAVVAGAVRTPVGWGSKRVRRSVGTPDTLQSALQGVTTTPRAKHVLDDGLASVVAALLLRRAVLFFMELRRPLKLRRFAYMRTDSRAYLRVRK